MSAEYPEDEMGGLKGRVMWFEQFCGSVIIIWGASWGGGGGRKMKMR